MKRNEREAKKLHESKLCIRNIHPEKRYLCRFLDKGGFMTHPDNKLEEKVIDALKRVHDPEIPVNIYDLGLVYELKINEQGDVYIKMTLTTPNCPIAEDMPGVVYNEVKGVKGVKEVKVDLVFDPPWDKDMISEAALLELGLL